MIVYQVYTPSLKEEFNDQQIFIMLTTFRRLAKSFPGEDLFALNFTGANNGEGKKIWYKVETYRNEDPKFDQLHTMMLPSDY
jgi:hypothetical protein